MTDLSKMILSDKYHFLRILRILTERLFIGTRRLSSIREIANNLNDFNFRNRGQRNGIQFLRYIYFKNFFEVGGIFP